MTSGQTLFRAYRNRHSGYLVESRRRLPAQLDSEPTVLRQGDDSRICEGALIAIRATRHSIALLLPLADAARFARPGLNPRIERLRVERIALSPRQLRSSRAARFLRAHMHNPGLVNNDFGLGFRFRACLRALASAIGSCFDLNRHKLRGRPKRLRRKHGLGKVEAKELVGTVLIRRCQTP